MNVKYMSLILFLIFGSVLAVNVNYKETIDITNIKNMDSIYAFNDELFVTLKGTNPIWRYKVNYDEMELERGKNLGTDFDNVKDVWVDGEIAYILTGSEVYKISYESKKLLFNGDSDSYFPDSPQSITVKDDGKYIYLVDKKNKRINIMVEYDKNKYMLNRTISVSSHGLTASYDEPYDIVINEDRMYVLDKGMEQIFVYESEEPNAYINIYAKGKGKYISKTPTQIEVDELFVYILEQKERIVLMDKESGEKVVEVTPKCDYEIERFAYDNNKIYVLCSEKEEIIIYDVDKRDTKTKEQVEQIYGELIKKVDISCEVYEGIKYYNLKFENRCAEFKNLTENYSYLNYNDAYYELYTWNSIVEGYNSGVKSQLNKVIEENVTFYLNGIKKGIPYTGARNYTAVRLMWDFEEILELRDGNEYSTIVSKMENLIKRYNDFEKNAGEEKGEEDKEGEKEEVVIKDINLVKLLNEIEYYKPLILEYNYFEMKVLDLEGVIIEVESNETEISVLESEFNKIKDEYLEYKEYYEKVSKNINKTEEKFEGIKGDMFVNVKEIEGELLCARNMWKDNPKEAWECLQNAESLMENNSDNNNNYLLLGIGGLIVVVIVLIIVIVGGVVYIKRKKKK